mmetsp:Transcript_65002/g.205352  ORF Transcript_65002/g.205352 Transcript_65002/m.205352 type:complete len:209 (+) Transcript_65002:803-1429(+)
MPTSSERSMKMRAGSAPQSTIWFLLSSFLKARVRRAPAAARCTLRSMQSRRATSGGMPPSARTRLFIPMFSCARLTMASAARRATPPPLDPPVSVCGGCRSSSFTSPGRACASAMRRWWSGLMARRPMVKHASFSIASFSGSSTPLVPGSPFPRGNSGRLRSGTMASTPPSFTRVSTFSSCFACSASPCAALLRAPLSTATPSWIWLT